MSKRNYKTSSGIDVKSDYSSQAQRPAPGDYPYTRGVHKGMYRDRLWTMRQYAGFSTAKESNLRYQELLKKGAKGLSVAFDLPTQMGYDSDDVMALGEVGKVGVAIDHIDDMRTLFDKIDLSQVSTSMTINSTASILLMLYELVAEENGVKSTELRGTIQNDILKEYISRGTYIFPPDHSLRIITNIFEYCKKNIPQWNTISISGYHIREAGSTAHQEIAFTLGNGLTYIDEALKAGLDIDDFAPRLSFFFNVHNNFLEEIAKFRAARSLWAKLLKERYNPKDEKSLKLRFHSQVAGSTLTAQQPLNNIVRVSLQALAAVMGGTQSLHTNSYDEALQLPTSQSAEIALRTQQVIAHESGVADFVDPFAGSGAVEKLTDNLEKMAHELILQIESMGGTVKCIENGFIQNEIMEAAYAAQLRIERKEDLIVGMNSFASDEEMKIPSNKVSDDIEREQVKRLEAFKAKRKPETVAQELSRLKEIAKSDNNLVPQIKACMQKNCTLGEVSHTLRDVFGVYKPNLTI